MQFLDKIWEVQNVQNTLQDTFTVEVPTFRGPLQLLLDLTERREVFIQQIPIAFIVEQLRAQQHTVDIEALTQISHLVWAKTRALCTQFLELPPQDEEIIPQDFFLQIASFQAAEHHAHLIKTHLLRHDQRMRRTGKRYTPQICHTTTLRQLHRIYQQLRPPTQPLPSPFFDPHVVAQHLCQTLKKGPLSLQEWIDAMEDKREKIGAFITLLDLIKHQTITISSSQHIRLSCEIQESL